MCCMGNVERCSSSECPHWTLGGSECDGMANVTIDRLDELELFEFTIESCWIVASRYHCTKGNVIINVGQSWAS